MAALTKNAISVTARNRAKQTKIWDHQDYKSQITIRDRAKRTKIWDHKKKSQITNILKNSKFYKKKFKMADLTKNDILVTVRDKGKWTKFGNHWPT